MSDYTPASWNTGLYLNELKNEIDEIGSYVGFYWNLIPVNGISISGNQTAGYTVSAPNGNDTMYAYSSLARNPTWTITYSIPDGTTNNMFVGISEDLTITFPSPTSPSMASVKYGMLTDQQTGNLDLYKIEDGKYLSTGFKWGTTYKITYDGTTLLYFVDDIQVVSYTIELNSCYLIAGSVYGGVINNITFSGSSSGGGGAGENLQMVLSNGNDAGNLNISNVNILTVRDIVASQGITASSFGVSLGPQQNGVVFDSLVHLPNVLINSNLVNINSKIYPCNTSTSILQFHTEDYNEILNNFTLFFKTLSFQFNVINGSNASMIYVQFFLSDTLNGDFDNTNPLNISWTSPNLNVPTGGDPLINTTKIMLALQSSITPLVDGIYLNIKTVSSDLTNTFQLQDFSFNTQLNSSFLSNKSQNPDIL